MRGPGGAASLRSSATRSGTLPTPRPTTHVYAGRTTSSRTGPTPRFGSATPRWPRRQELAAAQTEQLSTHIYNETYDELDELARDQNAVAHRWTDSEGPCLSIVDAQPLANYIQFQAYHLIANENLVLRTQSIFELK